MKIAILYICTGPYSIFWNQFYQSSERRLLIHHEKTYFVFTDDDSINEKSNIKIFKKLAQGFPLDSLLRFELFNSIKEHLEEFDFIYFFNSNMYIKDEIAEEIFPGSQNNGLVGVLHPGYYSKKVFWYPFEKRKKSKAFTKYNEQLKYYMGSFNGGTSSAYLKLISNCQKNIEDDYTRDIIAIYHDESHLNCYLNSKHPLMLSPAFAFPENSNLPFPNRITILDKVMHGGQYFDKLPKKAYIKRARKKFNIFIHSLVWKFFR